ATYSLSDANIDNTRWNYYRMSPEGHNTLTVNPFSPKTPNLDRTVLERRAMSNDVSFAISNFTATFAPAVSSWRRGIMLFDARQQVLVQDELTASSPTQVMWSMHTPAEVQV
ncbi:heparinase II/III domain-containing protein, partial [Streptomyces galilaeus]|uniref:heparinase II/III domain-containing protein n=1 Tax=Streptomyces galilaeus TaxID=33899 RepID=UPI0038F7F4C3